jgi:hypothetical protein
MVSLMVSPLIFSFHNWSTDKPTHETGDRLEVLLENIGVINQLVAHVHSLALLLELRKFVKRKQDFVVDNCVEGISQDLEETLALDLFKNEGDIGQHLHFLLDFIKEGLVALSLGYLRNLLHRNLNYKASVAS